MHYYEWISYKFHIIDLRVGKQSPSQSNCLLSLNFLVSSEFDFNDFNSVKVGWKKTKRRKKSLNILKNCWDTSSFTEIWNRLILNYQNFEEIRKTRSKSFQTFFFVINNHFSFASYKIISESNVSYVRPNKMLICKFCFTCIFQVIIRP